MLVSLVAGNADKHLIRSISALQPAAFATLRGAMRATALARVFSGTDGAEAGFRADDHWARANASTWPLPPLRAAFMANPAPTVQC